MQLCHSLRGKQIDVMRQRNTDQYTLFRSTERSSNRVMHKKFEICESTYLPTYLPTHLPTYLPAYLSNKFFRGE